MSVKLMGAIFDLAIPPSEKLMLLAMADHARDDGTGCYPAIATLAKKTSLSRRGTQKLIRRLQAAGYIADTGKISRFGTIEYTLTLARGGEQGSLLFGAGGRTAEHKRGEPGDAKGANLETQTSEPGSPESLGTNYVNQKLKGKTLAAAPPADPRLQPFLDYAVKIFTSKYGQPPAWSGKHSRNLQDFLSRSDMTLSEMCRRYENFILSTDPFVARQNGSVAFFCSDPDRYIKGPQVLTPWKGGSTNADERDHNNLVKAGFEIH
jgi:Helix-turn-helix domain